MPGPTDIIERAMIALVAVLDANVDIAAITGKANGNVTAWAQETPTDMPVLVYRYIVATPGGGAIGDTREIQWSFSAVAATESVANAMLEVVEKVQWAPVLAALNPPLNGYMFNPVRRPIPWDSDADASRADLELTLIVTK